MAEASNITAGISSSSSTTTTATTTTTQDQLNAILKANSVPNQEYYLQGSVLDDSIELLLQRLRGLCDNPETVPETFDDHEMCFSIASPEKSDHPVLSLRVRHALDSPTMPYMLRYVGKPEISESNPTSIRSCIDVAVSNNVVEFITLMGFKMDYDFIARGYMFRKGMIKISVIKIFNLKYSKKCCEPTLEALTRSYLVEAGIMAPTGQTIDADEVRLFAEKLRPIVNLEKIDLARI